MTASLLLLLPISVLMAALIGIAFWWAIFAGQFDEAGGDGGGILLDDDSTHRQPAGTAPPCACVHEAAHCNPDQQQA